MADTFEVVRVKYAGEKENPHDTRSPFFKFYCTFKDSQGNRTEDCYWQRKSRQLNEGEFFYGSITQGEYGFRFKTEQRPKNASNGSGPSDTGSGLTRAEWAQKDRRIARAGIVQAVVTGFPPPKKAEAQTFTFDDWLDRVDNVADALLARLDQHAPHPSDNGSADGGGGTATDAVSGSTRSTPEPGTSAAVSASPSPQTPAKGFSSDKQRDYFESLLRQAGASSETVGSIVVYAEQAMERKSVSLAIDSLKETPRETGVQLAELAKEWADKQSDVPADTTDLAPVGGGFGVGDADDSIPFGPSLI